MSVKTLLLNFSKFFGVVVMATLFINCPSDGLYEGEEDDLGPLQKFRLMWRENPATTMVVGWTQTNGGDANVYYGTVDNGDDYTAYPGVAGVDNSTTWKDMDHQFARLTGLNPDTAYYFVIRDDEGNQSPRFWFQTAPDNRDSFTFVSGGDSRNNRDVRQAANKMVAKLRPLFVAFGGDYTEFSIATEWKAWLNDWQLTIADDGRMTPIVATRGNHETSNKDVHRIFDTPDSDNVYLIRFGDDMLDLYTLNSEISIEGFQSDWLQGKLYLHQDTHWKMAQYHRPIRPHVGSKTDQETQRARWANPFYQYGVNLVIESDAHTVKTTWPIKPTYGEGHDEGFKRDDARGTVYMGEGTWGAPIREADDNKEWTRASGMFNQFKWGEVTEEKITVRTIKYENVDEVESVSDADPFVSPAGIDIWQPEGGAEVTILPMEDWLPEETITKTFWINSSSDDAEENTSSGSVDLDSSDLEMIRDDLKFKNQIVGLRFTGVTVPLDAKIQEAYIQFTVDESGDRDTDLIIKGHDVGNSWTFSDSDDNISSRTTTALLTAWYPAGWDHSYDSSLDQRTPDLSGIVQEIIDNGSWDDGNAMSFIISGSGRRNAIAFDGSAANAPTLTISYTESTE